MDQHEVHKDPSALWAAVRQEVARTGATPQAVTREMAEALLKSWLDQLRLEHDEGVQNELRGLPPEDRREREAMRAAERAQILLEQDLEVREYAAALEDTYLREALTRVPFPRDHYAAAQERLSEEHLREDAEMLLRHERDLDWHHSSWARQRETTDFSRVIIREERRQNDEDRLYCLHGLELDNLKARHKVEGMWLGICLQDGDSQSQTVSGDRWTDQARIGRQRRGKGLGMA